MTSRKWLEKLVQKGEATKKRYMGLKNGYGYVCIYKDSTPHPDPKVYESGSILFEKDASIGYHLHTTDTEIYICISGRVEVNGIILEEGDCHVCERGAAHSCRNIYDGESIVGFAKSR